MNPYGIQEYFLCFATLLFTAIHVAGWNSDFPTPLERLLWRSSSLMLFGIRPLLGLRNNSIMDSSWSMEDHLFVRLQSQSTGRAQDEDSTEISHREERI
jgi:hypothetical protein